jgi:ABC-type polysaccharide/polyol phosphate transport system ATPase subunit
VTKKFRVHFEKNSTLKEKLLYFRRAKYREFIALQDVSFEIPRGTTVGLIGVNGSGKSTLLKLISRIMYPDSGKIVVNGRISSLLELGAGFHPDFTGRENIFMNGALLGFSKKEISEKLDEIVDFSELGDFINEPVRSYSSGMYMRLAFSVAVTVDPEVLLIDEILAVGDAPFQAKCMNRIKQMQNQDKTIVIVTHDPGAVEKFCDSVVWMHNSMIKKIGKPSECIKEYIGEVFRDSRLGNSLMSFDRIENNEILENSITVSKNASPIEHSNIQKYGSGEISITNVRLKTYDGSDIVECGTSITIEVEFQAHQEIDEAVYGIAIYGEDGVRCYGTNSLIDRLGTRRISRGINLFNIELKQMNLLPGTYTVDIAIHPRDGEPYEYLSKACRFTVISDVFDVGICRLDHSWTFAEIK